MQRRDSAVKFAGYTPHNGTGLPSSRRQAPRTTQDGLTDPKEAPSNIAAFLTTCNCSESVISKPDAVGMSVIAVPLRSKLLSLPKELQLFIWELVIRHEETLYVNGPCDSSFGGWNDEYYADVALWENGTKKPPKQPPLTQVCQDIRLDTLPMFYKFNRFQSGYCYETNVDMTIGWLRAIGDRNCRLLTNFYFFDANYMHDEFSPKDLKKLQRGPVFKEMGGRMVSSYSDDGCLHEVRFEAKNDDEELEGLSPLFTEVGVHA